MTVQKGKKPTEEHLFYLKWGQETIKNNIALANGILKQLITLSSALLGLSIIYESIVTSEILKIFVLISFFASLIVAFLGLLPYEDKVNIHAPLDIKEHKKKALKHKRRFLWISAIALVFGFALILSELIYKAISTYCK